MTLVARAAIDASPNPMINASIQNTELYVTLKGTTVNLIQNITIHSMSMVASSPTTVTASVSGICHYFLLFFFLRSKKNNKLVTILINSPLGTDDITVTGMVSTLSITDADGNILGLFSPSAQIIDSEYVFKQYPRAFCVCV